MKTNSIHATFLIVLVFCWACSSADGQKNDDGSVADEIAQEAGDAEESGVDSGDDVAEGDEDKSEESDEEVADNEEEEENADEDNMEEELAEVEEEEDLGDELDDSKKVAAEEKPAVDETAGELAENSGVQPEGERSMATETEPTPQPELAVEQPAEAPKWIPVKKIAPVPFKSATGQNMNTVYIMRKDDDLAGVSKKIYGTDRVEELTANNPHLKKSSTPGTKVYYNSPKRPNDESKMLTYYEDNGIPPEVYTTKEGDNIREVASSLLGYESAWQEVWATNDVESKQFVPAGVNLRYWKSDAAPSGELAQNQKLPPPESELPPAPALEGSEPQHDVDGSGLGTTDSMRTPPPSLPPPPPPPEPPPQVEMKPVANNSSTGLASGSDNSTLMMAAAAVLLLGAVAFISIRSKNRKRLDFEYTTQA